MSEEGSLSRRESPDFSNPRHLAEMGAALAPLATDRSRWIRRRTDRVVLQSESHLQRTVTLEIVVPDIPALIGRDYNLDHLPLPLGLHRKRLVTGLRIVSESGWELSLLTTPERRGVLEKMFDGLAEAALGHACADGLWLPFIDGDGPRAREAKDSLAATPMGATLLNDQLVIGTLLEDLTDDFYLLVLCPYSPGAPRIIHLTYDEYLTRPPRGSAVPSAPRAAPAEGVRGRARRVLGWMGRLASEPGPIQVAFAVGQAASFHAEVTAPPGLVFPKMSLLTWTLSDSTVAHQERQVQEQCAIYAAGAERNDTVVLRGAFKTRPQGFGQTAQTVGFVTFVLFVLALVVRTFGLAPTGDGVAAAAIFVALPALFVLPLARDDQHPLTGQYTRGPRRAIVGFSAMALLGGAILALKFPASPAFLAEHAIGWRSVAWGAIGVFEAILLFVTVRARRKYW